jgi:hypothetical protein
VGDILDSATYIVHPLGTLKEHFYLQDKKRGKTDMYEKSSHSQVTVSLFSTVLLKVHFYLQDKKKGNTNMNKYMYEKSSHSQVTVSLSTTVLLQNSSCFGSSKKHQCITDHTK